MNVEDIVGALSSEDHRVLAWCQVFIDRHGRSPYLREIASAFQISKDCTWAIMNRLRKRGFIARKPREQFFTIAKPVQEATDPLPDVAISSRRPRCTYDTILETARWIVEHKAMLLDIKPSLETTAKMAAKDLKQDVTPTAIRTCQKHVGVTWKATTEESVSPNRSKIPTMATLNKRLNDLEDRIAHIARDLGISFGGDNADAP